MTMMTTIQSFSLPCNPRNPSLSFSYYSSSQLKLTTLPSHLSHNLFSKGCLSISTTKLPKRLSVICMARRYGSNTRKRQIKSRKRGGYPGKKRKRRRKSTRRKKDKVKIVRLVSAAGTGYVYTKIKGKKISKKLEIKKYDANVRHHVVFNETK